MSVVVSLDHVSRDPATVTDFITVVARPDADPALVGVSTKARLPRLGGVNRLHRNSGGTGHGSDALRAACRRHLVGHSKCRNGRDLGRKRRHQVQDMLMMCHHDDLPILGEL